MTKAIYIVSGECAGPGTTELYVGELTAQAIRARLARERCNGDRWAYAMLETATTHPERISDERLDLIEQ